MAKTKLAVFEGAKIRRLWDEGKEKWWFSVIDVIAVLTDSVDSGTYWRKLKERLKTEGNESVTKCHGFKMTAADGIISIPGMVYSRHLRNISPAPGTGGGIETYHTSEV